MTALDWVLAGVYLAALVGVGLWQRRRATASAEDYFVSGRKLPWYLAGTSMIAASFASDTPLLVSGLSREKGIWANWNWWCLGISMLLTTFFFSRLWRRAAVVTEAELTELRYSGRSAAMLRGFKAIYWGVFFASFTAGAWALAGLAKVMGAATGMDRTWAILACAGAGAAYAAASGLWGLVATDAVQFVLAVAGAVLLAVLSVAAAGGMEPVLAASAGRLEILPTSGAGWEYALPFLAMQWWAWKNTDGGGVLVQRMAACKDEKHAVYASLWYSFVHYGLRAWPWIVVGLASMVLIPDAALPRLANGAPDHQAAYGLMIVRVLPEGLRGLLVAWFLAEFMSAVTQNINWGGSLLVNDFYRRFVRRDAPGGHYVRVAQATTVIVFAGAVTTAFLSDDIAKSFNYVLKGTAGVGMACVLRWLWWRVNAWTEVSAMVLSPMLTFWGVSALLAGTAWEGSPAAEMGLIVGLSAAGMFVATLATRADDEETLRAFYRRVRPPGPGWARIARLCPDAVPDWSLARIAALWLLGLGCAYGTLFGAGWLLLGEPVAGAAAMGGASASFLALRRLLRNSTATAAGAQARGCLPAQPGA